MLPISPRSYSKKFHTNLHFLRGPSITLTNFRNMSNFEKLMVGKCIQCPPCQTAEFANSVVAELQKCLTPAPSSAFDRCGSTSSLAFDHCGCNCHERDEHGDSLQSVTTSIESDTGLKFKSEVKYSVTEVAKMNKKDFKAFLDRVRPPPRSK
jgi:hypothetical protein